MIIAVSLPPLKLSVSRKVSNYPRKKKRKSKHYQELTFNQQTTI